MVFDLFAEAFTVLIASYLAGLTGFYIHDLFVCVFAADSMVFVIHKCTRYTFHKRYPSNMDDALAGHAFIV